MENYFIIIQKIGSEIGLYYLNGDLENIMNYIIFFMKD